jgi:hypothetical protein
MGLALQAIDIGRADSGQVIGIAAIMCDTTSRFEELRVLRRHLAVRLATTGAESKNSYHDGAARKWDQEFESGFLQRRVRCELTSGAAIGFKKPMPSWGRSR